MPIPWSRRLLPFWLRSDRKQISATIRKRHPHTTAAAGLENDDTDGDGALDGVEVPAGSDPLDPENMPGFDVPVGLGVSIAGLLILLGICWRSYNRNLP